MTPTEVRDRLRVLATQIAVRSGSLAVDGWAAEVAALADLVPGLFPPITERRSGHERRQRDAAMNRPGQRQSQRRGVVRQYPVTPTVGYVTVTSPAPPNLGPSDTFQIVVLVESAELPSVSGPVRTDLTGSRTVTWATSDAGVATVSVAGLVTYVGGGTCTITATCEGVSATQAITCVAPAAAVSTVTVAPTSAALSPGATQILAATVRDAGGNVLVGRTVTWSSATPAVATVSADSGDDNHTATVTGVADGSSNVKATCEGVDSNLVATTVTSLATYRGANLPAGITAPGSLASSFGGATWDITDLVIGHARYTAATTLTVSSTGAAGRTELLAHLATHAAGSVDHKIVLPTGTLSGGIYTLPAKTDPTKHCWLVTEDIYDGSFGTARGTKIPASTTGMTILQGPAAVTNSIVVCAQSGDARGYSFHGCVIQPDLTSAAYTVQLGVVEFRRTSAQTSLDTHSGRLYFDRCWIRGSPTANSRRGVYANGPYFWIEDSRITDIHWAGNECSGIGGFSGSRYHMHRNLTIEAGTQAILYGGADPQNPQTNILDPADIFTDKVYAFKPLTWLPTHGTYAGTEWTVKTGFEAKNCRRWVIDRSITQNNWPDAQNGYSMLFQNLSDGNTNHLENRVEDIVVRHHRFDYVANGLNLLSRVAYGGTLPVNKMNRMVFDNILMTRCGGNNTGTDTTIKNIGFSTPGYYGAQLQLLGDIQNLVVDRWTAGGWRALIVSGTGATNWTLTNMVHRMGQYGVFGDNGPGAKTSIALICASGLTMGGNVGYDLSSVSATGFAPEWDANETNTSMAFADYAGYDHRLTTEHLTKGVGGGVPGCDIDELETQLAGVAD